MIAVFLADGFEEIEALATVDILRRAGLTVRTVGVGTANPIGAHHMQVKADMLDVELNASTLNAVVLPGGMPGTLNLEKSTVVQDAIQYAAEHKLPIGAICAAPSILGHGGYLHGLRATCYPGFETDLDGAVSVDCAVITDGNITTASGAGVAVDFALELVSRLASSDAAAEIRSAIQCR